jgi:hypothetical protein
MSVTPNYTCEVCWCVVLKKYERDHERWHRKEER